MAVRDVFKVSRKTFLNPSAWINLDGLVDQTKSIWGVIKGVMRAPTPGAPETFEEAVKRQGLSEKDIQEGIATYKALAIVFTILAAGAFAYSLILLFQHRAILGTALSLAVSGLFFGQAFRYDFWSLQMSKRKLGLTYADWKQHYLGK